MKKILLLGLLTANVIAGYSQVHSLSQDFNGVCVTSSGTLPSWTINTMPGPLGYWVCNPTGGRSGTPGISCSGTYSSAYHVDTSLLISPLLNLSTYAGGHVYLHYDTKTTNIVLGGKLAILKAKYPDSTLTMPAFDTDITSYQSPVFSNNDSTNWVTHEIDMTRYIDSGDFFIAFRYTSTALSGNTWFIDNIGTSTVSVKLDVQETTGSSMGLQMVGTSAGDRVVLSYDIQTAGRYHLALFDLMGRLVRSEELDATPGRATYTISDLNLRPGLYLAKMYNEYCYGITRVMVN